MPVFDNNGYKGAIDNPDIKYSSEAKGGTINKVVATLNNYMSGRYTKLGRNLKRIEFLEKHIKRLKEEVKQDNRELVQDLFNAEDTIYTRVVETVGFIFKLTKDPKETVTVQNAKVLEELEEHLTPELIVVLNSLKKKYETKTQKAPGLSYVDKGSMNEANDGMFAKLKAYFKKFTEVTDRWATSYDSRLDALKAMVEEPVTEEAEGNEDREAAIEFAFSWIDKEVANAREKYEEFQETTWIKDAFTYLKRFYAARIARRTSLNFSDWDRTEIESMITSELLKSPKLEAAIDTVLSR